MRCATKNGQQEFATSTLRGQLLLRPLALARHGFGAILRKALKVKRVQDLTGQTPRLLSISADDISRKIYPQGQTG
jgi:hypothetical protein